MTQIPSFNIYADSPVDAEEKINSEQSQDMNGYSHNGSTLIDFGRGKVSDGVSASDIQELIPLELPS